VRSRDQHKLEPPAPFGPNPETATVARTSVEAALAVLAPKRRAVIVLIELEELSTSEVAQLLGMPAGTVRWHLSRGKKELRSRLADELASQEIST
jgi:RNA polymerase sigma-70 factor (ECF subfamily)